MQLAEEKDCMLISTPYDTFTVARLINQSMPIKYIMKKEHLITFELEDYVDDVKETMSKVRHRDFPEPAIGLYFNDYLSDVSGKGSNH